MKPEQFARLDPQGKLHAVNTYLETLGSSVWAGGTAHALAAEQDAEGKRWQPLEGVAVRYDMTIHAGWVNFIFRPGSMTETLIAPSAGTERDILLLHTHQLDRPLGRTGRDTLAFRDHADRLEYSARLDLGITSVRLAAEEVSGGLLDHSSIGFGVQQGEWDGVTDNCGDPKCLRQGLELSHLITTTATLFEMSLVPQGACIGTSARSASRSWAFPPETPPEDPTADPAPMQIPASRLDEVLRSASKMRSARPRRLTRRRA